MFATSVTRPPHKRLGLAHILTAVSIDSLAEFFRCKEAAQLRRVAVDFAFNSLSKDKVSPEARQWEKRRDEKELEAFLEQIERYLALAENPSGSQWREAFSPLWATREKIKDKTFDEAEAYLKDVDKRIHHILNETTTNCSFICASTAFRNPDRSRCHCGQPKRPLML